MFSFDLICVQVAMQIARGEFDIGIAGGVETLSDVHIRYPRQMRKAFVQLNFAKTAADRLKTLPTILRPSSYNPEISPLGEFTTGLNMGEHCEFLNKKFAVSRSEQDAFALRSHTNAANAFKAGHHSDIAPITVKKGTISEDNGVRVVPADKLAKLKPAYGKDGTVTAASASYLTDGASCTLLMSEDKALEMGLKPKATIIDWTYASLNPKEHGLLLGPAQATAKLLSKNKLGFKDFDVFEYHEAFAGQLLANIKAMDCEVYSKDELELNDKLGALPIDKLNTWGKDSIIYLKIYYTTS